MYNNLNHIKDIKTQPVSFQVSIFSNSELSQITNEFPLSYKLYIRSTLSALLKYSTCTKISEYDAVRKIIEKIEKIIRIFIRYSSNFSFPIIKCRLNNNYI